jgi:hypothetical protein
MLLSRNRLFGRKAPSREAKIIYIFCEGADRELRYFQYFQGMDSRIHLEIHELHPHEDNSPLGLFQIATIALIASEENPNPKFNLQEQDEVWIVLDSDPDREDSRKPQITIVKAEVKERKGWFVVESNPCFEVWLYYHGREEVEEFEDKEKCKSWKGVVNSVLAGGFDPRKHPIFIQDAKRRAEVKFELGEDGHPKIGSTEVYRLADSILRLLGDEIREVRTKRP